MIPRYMGRWRIVRSIVDGANATRIECAGHAVLQPNGDRLRYDEAVALHVGERLIRATRTYFYRLSADAISATFADGGAFFDTALRLDGTATAIHTCGGDVYVGTLVLRETNTWSTCWDVGGAKALRITTYYTRSDQISTIAPYVSGRRSR